MKQTSQRPLKNKAKLTQFLIAMSLVAVLAYASMYLMAMSPLLIRILGPVLASE
jgi:hypothetical protein